MQVLKVLSEMWKAGAEIYRDPNDRQLVLKNHEKIPKEIMDAAEKVFPQIDEWFQSWENETAAKITIRKALHLLCGWERNEKLNKWLCNDVDSLLLLHDWTMILAENGWKDIYSDFRNYEDEKSDEMALEFYQRAINYAKTK